MPTSKKVDNSKPLPLLIVGRVFLNLLYYEDPLFCLPHLLQIFANPPPPHKQTHTDTDTHTKTQKDTQLTQGPIDRNTHINIYYQHLLRAHNSYLYSLNNSPIKNLLYRVSQYICFLKITDL